MKKNLVVVGFIAIVSFSACAGNPPKVESEATETVGLPGTVDSTRPVLSSPNTTVGANPVQTATAPSSASVALNPEHGKPNHRCDIAVGAPLNSPAQQVQPGMQPAQTLPPMQTLPAPAPAGSVNGTVRLNPAHGMPGHDCAVPVGQPLKS